MRARARARSNTPARTRRENRDRRGTAHGLIVPRDLIADRDDPVVVEAAGLSRISVYLFCQRIFSNRLTSKDYELLGNRAPIGRYREPLSFN